MVQSWISNHLFKCYAVPKALHYISSEVIKCDFLHTSGTVSWLTSPDIHEMQHSEAV